MFAKSVASSPVPSLQKELQPNLTQDDVYKYKYDAENRLVELRYLNDTLIASYAFDGNSLRVVKVWGADRTVYIYAGTQLISEFEDAASNTYSAGTTPGQAGSDSTSTMLYQHSDHLTTRLTTDNNGDLSNEQAHYPYGEQWYAGGTADPSVLRKFTSYQREDEATNGKLNYAVFREQSARIGRFLMADPKRGNVRNPQRLNRYAYVTNDPTNRVDLLGQDFDDERTELLELVDGRRGARVIIGAELSAGFQVAWASSLTTGLWCGFGSYGYVPCDPPLGGGGLPLPGFGGGSGWLAGGGSGTWTCEEARASCNQTAMQYAKDCAEGFAIGAIQCEIACAAGCAPAALFTPLGYGSCFLACSARCATVAGIGSMHCVMEAMNMSKHCTDEYNACVARRNRRR